MTGPGPGDPLDRASGADAWLADARAEEAASERRRERARRMIASDEIHLVVVARALAGIGERVVVITGAGSRAGTIDFVGRDFVTVTARDGATIFVPLSAVVAIRSDVRVGETAPPARDVSLVAALSDVAGDRSRAQVATAAGRLAGVVEAVGTDVVLLRLDGGDNPVAHVSINAIFEVVLLG